MIVTVDIPASLRRFTANESEVNVTASSVGEAFSELLKVHPKLEERIFSQGIRLRSFVNVFVNGKNIRYLENERTTLADGDKISVIPAIAGG